MKTKHLLLLVLVAVLSSCSSAYKIGQTPDDVYYSPAPPPPVEYVTTDQQENDGYPSHPVFNSEDLAIRRGINDPVYRSNLSLDFGFGYNPYDYYGYGSSFYSPYSPYYSPYSYSGLTFYPHNYSYNSYYSPYSNYYYYPALNFSTYTPAGNYPAGPRTYNLGAYSNVPATNRGLTHPGQATTNNSAPVRTFPARTGNRSGVGNFIRNVFTPSNSNRTYSNDNSSNNNSSPSRNSGSSGSSSSRSGGGGGGSSAPVRTFR